MAGTAEVETGRLLCRRPQREDLPEYRRLFTDPDVRRWVRPAPLEPFSENDIDVALTRDLHHWEIHGFGPWALICRDREEFAGRAGLAWTRIERRPAVELPWSLLPEARGRGLATEAASAALDVARAIGLVRVVSLALIDNVASRRVMEKVGLGYERDVEHFGLRHVLYACNLNAA